MALSSTIICLVYTIYDWPELQKHDISKDMNVFYSESKTDLSYNVTAYKIPAI
jgi:hypothetical protein